NLHSLIHKRGLTVPLQIHTVEIPVRKRKPKVEKVWVHYPVILPTTWEWYDMRANATWRDEKDPPSPFKQGGSPLHAVPGLTSPESVMIDSAHTWHIGIFIWERNPSKERMLKA
ncbi:Uncharacterized protein SCF082_LOCUS21236, partial [Durusdinium trenchii]